MSSQISRKTRSVFFMQYSANLVSKNRTSVNLESESKNVTHFLESKAYVDLAY